MTVHLIREFLRRSLQRIVSTRVSYCLDVLESVPTDGFLVFGYGCSRYVEDAFGKTDIVECPVEVGNARFRIVHLKDRRIRASDNQFVEFGASCKCEAGY